MTAPAKTWAVVTGASSGLGVEFARKLAARGHNLVLTARRLDRLTALADELRGGHHVDVHVVQLDLAEPGAPEVLLERATANGRRVHVLISNAGFGQFGQFLDTPLQRHADVLRLNAATLTELSWHFARHMREHGEPSHILHVASIGAFQPVPGMAVYAAAKSYVRNFSEALAFELRSSAVRVTCLCPGGTTTEFTEVAGVELNNLARGTMMTAAAVAGIGLDALFAGTPDVTSGLVNKLSGLLVRFAPRSLATRIAAAAMAGPSRLERPAA